jgi:hypothetical protein
MLERSIDLNHDHDKDHDLEIYHDIHSDLDHDLYHGKKRHDKARHEKATSWYRCRYMYGNARKGKAKDKAMQDMTRLNKARHGK